LSGEIRILVLCNDPWHPARTVRAGLTGLQKDQFAFDWVEDVREWAPELIRAYPLVILARSNGASGGDPAGWMTPAVESVFAEYVRQGNGLLAIHSGTADYDQAPLLRALLGGVFARHPEPCPVTVEPRDGHPLCIGSTSFTLVDEHYFMTVDDPQMDVFMTTRSRHGEQPGAWRRTAGRGRVAVLTPGHTVEVWQHPSFQNLLLNSLRWCVRLI